MKHSAKLYIALIVVCVTLLILPACSSKPAPSTSAPQTTTTKSAPPASPSVSPTPQPTPPATTSIPPTTSPPPVTTTPPPTTTPVPTSTSPAQSVTIDLTAQNMAFDKTVITVPAGAAVTMNFTNRDSVPHNFAAYTNQSLGTKIFVGTTITASTTVYKFNAPSTPGNYFFRCDIHPSMTGTLVVQ